MTAGEVVIALFVLWCLCRGPMTTGGQGVHPDELRRREMDRIHRERFGGGE